MIADQKVKSCEALGWRPNRHNVTILLILNTAAPIAFLLKKALLFPVGGFR